MTQAATPTLPVYNDTPVKIMIYPAVIFLLFGMLVGVFLSFNGFVFPDYYQGEYIHFGRIRPVHVQGVALLWLFSADIGLLYYVIPRLCGTALWSSKLAYAACAVHWSCLLLGVFSFPWGTNSGWEYAELPMWLGGMIPIKALFTLAWVLFGINTFMTIINRNESRLYVSIWYTMAAIIWTAVTVFFGNFAIEMIPGGISRVNMNYFYVHNLVGLIFTPLGLASTYYFVPKIAQAPLYSHRMSMIGFWTIAFTYAWVGAHHIIHGPISQWLQTVSIVFSFWLLIPVWTVVANLFLTLKGHWNRYTQSAAMRFLMAGNLFYLFTAMQGSLQAFRNVNEITSKTDWIVGHAHMALFGTFTYFAIAGVYHVIPVITKKPLWSKTLADWHFTMTLLGSLIFFAALWVGGYFQGLEWARWAEGANFAEMRARLGPLSFLETVANMRIWWLMRALGGTFILIATTLFVVNIYNTIVLPARVKDEDAEPTRAGN